MLLNSQHQPTNMEFRPSPELSYVSPELGAPAPNDRRTSRCPRSYSPFAANTASHPSLVPIRLASA